MIKYCYYYNHRLILHHDLYLEHDTHIYGEGALSTSLVTYNTRSDALKLRYREIKYHLLGFYLNTLYIIDILRHISKVKQSMQDAGFKPVVNLPPFGQNFFHN